MEPKFHYCDHKSPQLVYLMNQIYPVSAFLSCLYDPF